MKKSFVLLTVLLVLITGTACYAQSELLQEKDQVHFTEKVLYGDKSIVEGVKVDTNISYEYQLFWHTLYEIGATPKEETEYTFYPNQYQDRRYVNSGSLSFQMNGTDTISNDFEQDRIYYGIDKAMKELADRTAPGTQESATVYLKDYMEYYSFIHEIDLPYTSDEDVKKYNQYGYWRLNVLLEDIERLEKNAASKENLEQLEDLKKILKDAETLQEFFKIPVLETEVYEIVIKKDTEGKICGMAASSTSGGSSTGNVDFPEMPDIEGLDGFCFSTYSVYDNGDCYFTFDTRTFNGNVVDTSLIPGGYGIYHFSYDKKNGTVDLENLKMVYALDVKTNIEDIRVDESGKNLLITTSDETTRYMQVIDRETMTLVDTFHLGDRESYVTIWNFEEYMVIRAENIMVFAYGEDGRYTQALSVNFSEVEQVIKDATGAAYVDILNWDTAFDWDGEKLLMANQILLIDERLRATRTCNFYVAAIDENGLVYYGEYTSTLDCGEGGHKQCYFNPDMDQPILVRWK